MKFALMTMGVSVFALGACATITRGTTTAFTVETEPSGASVTTSLGQKCEASPCAFSKVSREAEFDVTISKPGYRTTTHHVTHKTAGNGGAAMAGNVLVGGLIGAAIDGNNGATQDLVPNPLRVTLEKEVSPVAAPAAVPAEPAAPPAAPDKPTFLRAHGMDDHLGHLLLDLVEFY